MDKSAFTPFEVLTSSRFMCWFSFEDEVFETVS